MTRFNTYLLVAALTALLTGCETASSRRDKEIATLRVFLEAGSDPGSRGQPVIISRAARITINVEPNPILNEALIKEAKIVETTGTFALAIQYDHSGTLMLEQYTAINNGRRFVIAAQFGEKDKAQQRWLAAPLVSRRISDGVLAFTPDATREEAEEIARGLNNLAIKNGNQEKPKKSKEKEKPKTS